MTDNYNDFVDFLGQVCDIDSTRVPDMGALCDQCEQELQDYVTEGDTVAREELMSAVSNALVGMDWPTYSQSVTEYEAEFNQRMEYFINDEE